MKDDRSGLNPFTGKEHLDIVNDDAFLANCSNEYYKIINQNQLLDDTPNGQLIINVTINLINAVEECLKKIGRYDYIEDYYDWDVHLVNNDTVNAMCMPGGKILVFSGILQIANSEETIAFILAHEMAHALLDHGRTETSADAIRGGLTAVGLIGGLGLSLLGMEELGGLALCTTNLANIGSEFFVMKPFEREHEMEADKLGIMITKWAGYDISKIPDFWQEMSKVNSNEFDFFSTHPSDSKRIGAMKAVIAQINNDDNFSSNHFLEDSNSQFISKNTFNCNNCGAILEENVKFCNICGHEVGNTFKCVNCGAILEENAKFCNICGVKVNNSSNVLLKDNPKYCPNCGSKLDVGAHFCPNCGINLNNL